MEKTSLPVRLRNDSAQRLGQGCEVAGTVSGRMRNVIAQRQYDQNFESPRIAVTRAEFARPESERPNISAVMAVAKIHHGC